MPSSTILPTLYRDAYRAACGRLRKKASLLKLMTEVPATIDCWLSIEDDPITSWAREVHPCDEILQREVILELLNKSWSYLYEEFPMKLVAQQFQWEQDKTYQNLHALQEQILRLTTMLSYYEGKSVLASRRDMAFWVLQWFGTTDDKPVDNHSIKYAYDQLSKKKLLSVTTGTRGSKTNSTRLDIALTPGLRVPDGVMPANSRVNTAREEDHIGSWESRRAEIKTLFDLDLPKNWDTLLTEHRGLLRRNHVAYVEGLVKVEEVVAQHRTIGTQDLDWAKDLLSCRKS